jgi:Aspartyl protease/PDZ domain
LNAAIALSTSQLFSVPTIANPSPLTHSERNSLTRTGGALGEALARGSRATEPALAHEKHGLFSSKLVIMNIRGTLFLGVVAVFCANIARAQDVIDILQANEKVVNGAAWKAKETLALEYAYAGQGMTGTTASTCDLRTGAFVDRFEIGPTTGANGFDMHEAWMQDLTGAVTPQAGGDTRELAFNEAYRDANLWWRADRGGATISSRGTRTDAGESYDALTVAPRGGKPFEAWFGSTTHLLARIIEPQGFQTVTTYISDYRSVGDARFAGKQVIDDGSGEQYRQTLTLTSARFVPAQAPSAYAAPVVKLHDAGIANGANSATIPFKLLNNHIYANVLVNGKGPFFFVFDTGGHDLLMPATAKALGIATEGAGAGMGAGEAVVTTSNARGVTFEIGDVTLKNQTIAIVPFSGGIDGYNEQGMIGFEIFRRFVTVIDYGKRTLTFIDPAHFDPRGAGIALPFVFYSHLPQIEGSFEGKAGKFDIDTGSRDEVTITKPFVDANNLIAKHPNGVTAVDGWGVGGRSVSYLTRSDDLTLGTVKINHVVAGFSTQSKGSLSDPNFEGNVGSGLLKRFVVSFDYDHQIMYLKPLVPPVPDAGAFDRAGFWINATPKGFEIVDLTPGGPAQKAGLQTGERIVAVDGVAVAALSLSALRQRLRDDKSGTVVKLKIAHDDSTRLVALTLADQI